MKIDNIRPAGATAMSSLASPETAGKLGKLDSKELQSLLKVLDMILKVLGDGQGGGDGGGGQGAGQPPKPGGPGGPLPQQQITAPPPPQPPAAPPVPQPPAAPAPAPAAPAAPPQPPQQQPAAGAPTAAPGSDPGAGGDLTPQQISQTYGKEIQAASQETGVPPDILAGMIWQESKGRPNTPGGGLMQIGPNEFASHGGGDINNPADNIMAGARYLSELSQQFGGDMPLALRAYNSGPLGVDPSNPDATPAGTGDPTYVGKVLDAAGQSGL